MGKSGTGLDGSGCGYVALAFGNVYACTGSLGFVFVGHGGARCV